MLEDLDNSHSILILGDGDFSFTKALLRLIPTEYAKNIVATVFDDEITCFNVYSEAKTNVEVAKRSVYTVGVHVVFNVDATNLESCDSIVERKRFDRIIFNFPHTGGKTNLRKCKQLLKGIFHSCSRVMSVDDGRFYLTLAQGQSGVDNVNQINDDDQLPTHIMDSWQALYMAPYTGFGVEKILPFEAEKLSEFGYQCTGYKNRSRKFHIENSQTLVFRHFPLAEPQNLHSINDENDPNLNNFRPFYTHDIAFWVNDEFDRETFDRTCRRFSKGLIKRIIFLSQYSLNDSTYAHKNLRTLCFRLVWQSSSYAMTRESCRDMQILLRNHLRETMPTSLSFLLR